VNKVAVVTGGTRGIGEAICSRLLADGYRVIALDVDATMNHLWAVKQATAGFEKAEAVVCDVTDLDKCKSVIGKIIADHGRIDLLVNNAGITRDSTFRKMNEKSWYDVINVNLNSMFNVTRPVIENMLENRSGRIINISSVNGQKGQFGQTNYSAAKAGIHGFTKALAQEVANKNITVNTISPGYMNTNMMKDIPDDVLASIKSQIPAGRLGEPEEVADLIRYLSSDVASYITGANIAINGGQHMY